ncbi:MAG: V-type ATP synthase subunit E family protein [Syntrophales bacterium]|nr:V-type ATP synthase subunit E family protein [Syntrophales bacterium]
MKQPPLEESIRKESEETIYAIREKEVLEMKGADEACAAEIEAFKEKAEAEVRAKIEQELSRLESKALLERKKLNLRGLDDFMVRMVKEAVQIIRTGPRYKTFLLDRVRDAVGEIQGGVEVYLQKEDLVFEEEIMKTVKGKRRKFDAALHEDAAIQWGGCTIRDGSNGRIFNNTIERIYYRKSPTIRREIMKILNEKGVFFR